MAAVQPAAEVGARGSVVEGKEGKSTSKTVTDTITGEHEHTIVGYTLVKGIGDGEPIASERFSVGGHEWVLLFYPDGKRSSSTEGHVAPPGEPQQGINPPPQPNAGAGPANPAAAFGAAPQAPARVGYGAPAAFNFAAPPAAPPQIDQGPGQIAVRPAPPPPNPPVMGYPPVHVNNPPQIQQQHPAPQRREATNDYAALFVALIGESDNPQGVVQTSDGRVVRAFHRFTLVDQSGLGRHLSKGRRRDQGAVKISCARQDPNARNCHGYRKFVKRSLLESAQVGGPRFLVDDTIIIRYTIELVVSSGGALSRVNGPNTAPKVPLIQVPTPSLGRDLAGLFESGSNSDLVFKVEDEEMKVHRIVLSARSAVFAALLNAPMREGTEGVVDILDVRAPVFRALLHFVYTDSLPEELDGANLDVAMAQHLLVAADRFELTRLRRICERRLCETVEVESVATTLALAEQNHAEELKRVCLEYVSRHLGQVMTSEGYQHMIGSCPQLQAELLRTIAVSKGDPSERHRSSRHAHVRDHDNTSAEDQQARRVRQRPA